jgi:glyoxylase-like metal-dependent hydrolase (beta-lactamase superfamily II)
MTIQGAFTRQHSSLQAQIISIITMPFSSGSTSAMSPSTVSALSPFDTQQPSGQGSPVVHCFYDNSTATWTYIVADPETKKAVIIDSVLDYDPASGKIAMDSVKGLVAFVQEQGYEVERIMETHVHADHLTGAVALKEVSQ